MKAATNIEYLAKFMTNDIHTGKEIIQYKVYEFDFNTWEEFEIFINMKCKWWAHKMRKRIELYHSMTRNTEYNFELKKYDLIKHHDLISKEKPICNHIYFNEFKNYNYHKK